MSKRLSGGQATIATSSSSTPVIIGGQADGIISNARDSNNNTVGDQAINLERRQEKVRLLKRKVSGFRCEVCSEKQIIGYTVKEKHHQHFCSKFNRECVGILATEAVHYCPPCKRFHKNQLKGRIKLCISDSVLHKFWDPKNIRFSGDDTHIEYITIRGARINALTEAWEIQYGSEPRPMDILLVAGQKNIEKGAEVEKIMRAFKHFIDLVTWQGQRFHPGVKNTCAIAPLLYPPKLCWFTENGPPPPNFQNQIGKVKSLNAQIERLNEKSRTKAPNFTTFGLRKSFKRGRDCTKHRWSHWREEVRSEKIHLTEDIRVKMGRQVVKYFRYET